MKNQRALKKKSANFGKVNLANLLRIFYSLASPFAAFGKFTNIAPVGKLFKICALRSLLDRPFRSGGTPTPLGVLGCAVFCFAPMPSLTSRAMRYCGRCCECSSAGASSGGALIGIFFFAFYPRPLFAEELSSYPSVSAWFCFRVSFSPFFRCRFFGVHGLLFPFSFFHFDSKKCNLDQFSVLCRSRRELSHEFLLFTSIQPSTSPVKFTRSPCTVRIIIITITDRHIGSRFEGGWCYGRCRRRAAVSVVWRMMKCKMLTDTDAQDDGRQALTFGGNRSGGYLFQLAFGCRSLAALVSGGFRRWTSSVNFRQLPDRWLLDFGSHRAASAVAFGGIDSAR